MRSQSPSLVILAILAAPGLASAQDPLDRDFRVAANLALGIGGELDSYVESTLGDSDGDTNLDPTLGLDLRVEGSPLDFLAIGGWFEALGVLVDETGAEREEYFALDAYARVRWAFEVVDDAFYIEPYVLLPIGISFSPLPTNVNPVSTGEGDDLWVGWNTAALLGAQFIHASGFGGFLELGWRHAEVYRNESTTVLGTTASADIALVMNELALNFGVLFAI